MQFDPIYVTFNVSERDVLRIRADLANRGQIDRANLVGLPVEVGLQSESSYPHKGKLEYTAPIVASLRRRRKLGQHVVNGIRISNSEIEELRNRGYEGDLVEAIETFLSDL